MGLEVGDFQLELDRSMDQQTDQQTDQWTDGQNLLQSCAIQHSKNLHQQYENGQLINRCCQSRTRDSRTCYVGLLVCWLVNNKNIMQAFSRYSAPANPSAKGGEVNTALFNFNFEGIQVLLTILKIAQEGYIETLCSFINSDITSQVTRVVPKWSNDPPLPLRC